MSDRPTLVARLRADPNTPGLIHPTRWECADALERAEKIEAAARAMAGLVSNVLWYGPGSITARDELRKSAAEMREALGASGKGEPSDGEA